MQGPDAEGVEWPDQEAAATWSPEDYPGVKVQPTYPEYPALPEARFSLCMVPDKPPMVTVRAQTAAELTAALNELEATGVYANIAAAYASLKAQGALGAGLGPVTAVPPQAAPQGPPMGAPAGPPFGPNVSVPQAPGYQGPPQGGYASPPQQGGGWGGQSQGSGPQQKPRPAGWAMVDVPFNDKDRFKALRAQGSETGNYLRGKIQWGGKGVYWLDPSIAGWIAQQGFPVMQ